MFIYFPKSFKKDLQVDMVEDGRTMSDLKRVLPQCFCKTLHDFAPVCIIFLGMPYASKC